MTWYPITLADLVILLAGLLAGGLLVLSFTIALEWLYEMLEEARKDDDGSQDHQP